MFLRWLTPFWWLAAFILLLLAALSAPIIPNIYLLSATADVSASVLGIQAGSAAETVHFGVWGWCAGEATYTVLGSTHELIAPQCSARHLGYTLDPTVSALLQLTNEEQNEQLILKGITTVLVLHPISCGLAFLALVLSFQLAVVAYPGWFSLLAVLPAVWLAAIVTTVTFVVDVVFVCVGRSKIWNATDGAVSVGFGNAVWLVLGAMIAEWIGLVFVTGGACCGERGWCRARGGRRNNMYDQKPEQY